MARAGAGIGDRRLARHTRRRRTRAWRAPDGATLDVDERARLATRVAAATLARIDGEVDALEFDAPSTDSDAACRPRCTSVRRRRTRARRATLAASERVAGDDRDDSCAADLPAELPHARRAANRHAAARNERRQFTPSVPIVHRCPPVTASMSPCACRHRYELARAIRMRRARRRQRRSLSGHLQRSLLDFGATHCRTSWPSSSSSARASLTRVARARASIVLASRSRLSPRYASRDALRRARRPTCAPGSRCSRPRTPISSATCGRISPIARTEQAAAAQVGAHRARRDARAARAGDAAAARRRWPCADRADEALRRSAGRAHPIERAAARSGAGDRRAAPRRAAHRERAEARPDARDRRRKAADDARAAARPVVQAGVRPPGAGAQGPGRDADARRGRRRSEEGADQRQEPRRLGRGAARRAARPRC